MSRPPKFEPFAFAKHTAALNTYAVLNGVLQNWNGKCWLTVGDEDALKTAFRWIVETDECNASAVNANAALRAALLWLPTLKDSTNTPVIPLQNGYLHLEGGARLRSFDKELGLRHTINCDFDPSAPTAKAFESFLQKILPDTEVRNRVQEYVGYTLLPDSRFHLAQIWIGSGANGKGTLANIVRALHGRWVAASPNRLENFCAQQLIGASLIYCDEAPPGDWSEQIMKSMIAGEPIFIDRKYLPAITTQVTGKWIICANHIPNVKDQSRGFWRRFDIVPFSVEIPVKERDPHLAGHIISHELTGVLNWALEGLQRLLDRGRFDATPPPAMLSAVQSARLENNSVAAWVNDAAIERTTTSDTGKAEVYSVYSIWCRQNGMVPFSALKFWKSLPDVMGPIVEGRSSTGLGRIRTCNVRLQWPTEQ